MRRLLLNPNTRHYLTSEGGWTENPGAAHHFADVSALIDKAIALRDTSELDQILMFADQPSAFDIRMPIKRVESIGDNLGSILENRAG